MYKDQAQKRHTQIDEEYPIDPLHIVLWPYADYSILKLLQTQLG